MSEFAEPEVVTVKKDDHGVLCFFLQTREGEELIDSEMTLKADLYTEGTTLTLREPIAADVTEPRED